MADMSYVPNHLKTGDAPLGMQLAFLAAGCHWLSAVVLFIGIATNDGEHSDEWEQKYPDLMDRFKIMNDFGHADSALLTKDTLTRMYDMQSFLVAEGLLESCACILAICCLVCVKAQMNYRAPADERELVTYACLIFGLAIPMLEFCLRAGPVSFVGWVGHEISKPVVDEPMFKNFGAFHIQMLRLALMTTESLFTWLNTFADLLLGVGFLQLSFLGSTRADIIFDHRTKLTGLWTAAIFLVCFFLGLLREYTNASGDHPLYVAMDLTVVALSILLGVFLVPAYFVLLGLGLGRVQSVESLNEEFGDAVAAVGAGLSTDRLRSVSLRTETEDEGPKLEDGEAENPAYEADEVDPETNQSGETEQ